ncbi:hypothetical protein LCGC14_1014200 [marine sediment metagenome]|uniref:Uncharacterized protein n=1 Tax=marine sediment metagenome TaxID=412755 RepID=A0A0F9MZC9_9ZZZZ
MRDLEKKNASARRYYQENKERCKEWVNKYRRTHLEDFARRNIEYRKRIKLECLTAYSCDPPKCCCCGESAIEFLSIDHIIGGGNKHRQELKRQNIYSYLKVNNYPLGYRVLCMNCNFAIGHYGYCPHQKKGG